MLKGLGNWLRKVSRSRMLRRIDRLMGLSDMELGKKTRKYFKRLHRRLNIRKRLFYISKEINDLGGFPEYFDIESLLTLITFIFLSLFVYKIMNLSSISMSLAGKIFLAIIMTGLPIIGLPISIFIKIFTTSPNSYDWPTYYKSRLTRTGLIGKVMNRLWKNRSNSGTKSNNDNRFFSSYFEGFNQMASLLNMDMDYLDESEYWSDEDYGRFMRIVLSYAFIYESAEDKPDTGVLSEFLNSDKIQSTAREVLDDVRKRKDRICGTGTSKDTSTEESSSTIVNEPDYDTIRSKDIQSRIVGKSDEVRNILDNENRMESGLG